MSRRVSSPAPALTLLAIVLAGCQNGVTGPSLTATVQNVSLQPTVVGLDGGQNVCCCHVRGQVTNSSSVTVHAELYFPAKATNGDALGTARDIQRDLTAGASRSFLAVGISAACKDVNLSQILTDMLVRVKGIWEPE